jgi:hypothetical protein
MSEKNLGKHNLKYPPLHLKAVDLLGNTSATLSFSSLPIALQCAGKQRVLEVITFIYKQTHKLRIDDCHCLGCNTMCFGRNVLTVQRILLPSPIVYKCTSVHDDGDSALSEYFKRDTWRIVP